MDVPLLFACWANVCWVQRNQLRLDLISHFIHFAKKKGQDPLTDKQLRDIIVNFIV